MNKFLPIVFTIIEIMIALFLALMILLVFLNVVGRYVFNAGFVWSEEIARLCFIFLVYLGSIEAMRDNRHLMIDTLVLRTPKPVQIGIYTVIQACIIWLMTILVRGSWGLVVQNRNNRWVVTGFPAHVVHFFGVILGVSIILIAVSNLIRLFVFAGLVASANLVAPIMPPSVPMIIYGATASVSINAFFLGGIAPALYLVSVYKVGYFVDRHRICSRFVPKRCTNTLFKEVCP